MFHSIFSANRDFICLLEYYRSVFIIFFYYPLPRLAGSSISYLNCMQFTIIYTKKRVKSTRLFSHKPHFLYELQHRSYIFKFYPKNVPLINNLPFSIHNVTIIYRKVCLHWNINNPSWGSFRQIDAWLLYFYKYIK